MAGTNWTLYQFNTNGNPSYQYLPGTNTPSGATPVTDTAGIQAATTWLQDPNNSNTLNQNQTFINAQQQDTGGQPINISTLLQNSLAGVATPGSTPALTNGFTPFTDSPQDFVTPQQEAQASANGTAEGLKPTILGSSPTPSVPTTQPQQSSTTANQSYTIQQGDTLSSLATKYGTTVAALLSANPQITNPNLIISGQSLNIPGATPTIPTTQTNPSTSQQPTTQTQQNPTVNNNPTTTPVVNSNTISQLYSQTSPGQTSPQVKQLQQALINAGYNIPDGATGYYGTETQAAVQSWLGSSNSNSTTDNGSTTSNGDSQITDPALQQVQSILSQLGIPMPNAQTTDPVTAATDTYTQVYQQLGLPTIQNQYDSFVQQQADLTTKQNNEIEAINDNPWMTQGVKDAQIKQINANYQDQQDNLTKEVTLLDTMYKNGQTQAQQIATQAITATHDQQTLDQQIYTQVYNNVEAQQKALASSSNIKSVNGGLYDTSTNEWVVAPTAKQAGNTIKSGGLVVGGSDIAANQQKLIASQGSDGYVNTALYNQMYANWTSQRGLASDFFKKFPPSELNPNDSSVSTSLKAAIKTYGPKTSSSGAQNP